MVLTPNVKLIETDVFSHGLMLTSVFSPNNTYDEWNRDQGGSAWRIAGKLKKHKNDNLSSCTFTTGFKICLYARHFDSSVCPHGIF